MTSDHAEEGFTLLEVLVAFVILSAALVTAHQSLSYSFRAIAAAQSTRSAAVLAEEILVRYAIDAPGVRETQGTSEDGLQWTVRAEPIEFDQAFQDVAVEKLVIEVKSPSGKPVGQYTTFRVKSRVAQHDDQ